MTTKARESGSRAKPRPTYVAKQLNFISAPTVAEPIAKLPIDHFDGLDQFDDLPRDGRCVGDLWF